MLAADRWFRGAHRGRRSVDTPAPRIEAGGERPITAPPPHHHMPIRPLHRRGIQEPLGGLLFDRPAEIDALERRPASPHRDFGKRFGDQQYVAESWSLKCHRLLCAELSSPRTHGRSAQYLALVKCERTATAPSSRQPPGHRGRYLSQWPAASRPNAGGRRPGSAARRLSPQSTRAEIITVVSACADVLPRNRCSFRDLRRDLTRLAGEF